MRLYSCIFFLLFALLKGECLLAQPSVIYNQAKEKIVSFVQQYDAQRSWNLKSISFEGNRVTKNYIIMREIPLREGDQITAENLLGILETSRLNLLNTQLFLEVIPYIDSATDNDIYLRFLFKERWYIFPLPYFNIIDRNPNQWLFEQKADLDRVNYGIKFTWENLTGRRDQVRFNFINGYRRQFDIYYEKPYSGKKLEHGFLIGASYSMLRQMTYGTERHKQLFFPSTTRTDIDFVSSSLNVELGYTYRRGVKYRHRVTLNYIQQDIADSINMIIINNGNKGYRPYFPNNSNELSFAQLNYDFTYLNVNNNAYPWKGFAGRATFTQKGLGLASINLWQFLFKAGKYIPVSSKNSFAFLGFGLLRLPFDQPTINTSGFGFGDMYMRGLEYYVIDAVAGAIYKSTFRRELWNVNIPTFLRKSDKYRKIPVKIIGKIYGDLGAAHLPFSNASFLNNTLLYSFGLGIDILSYYDFVAQFDFSANQLGEKGLFLHFRQEF